MHRQLNAERVGARPTAVSSTSERDVFSKREGVTKNNWRDMRTLEEILTEIKKEEKREALGLSQKAAAKALTPLSQEELEDFVRQIAVFGESNGSTQGSSCGCFRYSREMRTSC